METGEATDRVDRETEDFLSLVAHELKTPLTPLKSIAQLVRSRLRRSRGGELDLEALDRNLAAIERQVDRMDRLVTDLLEVTRVRRGRAFELAPRQMDLARAVRGVVDRWRTAQTEEGRHTFELASPDSLVVNADQERVEQVVSNLISNAVKYSPRGGTVRVRVEATDGFATVAVSDEGIGLRREEIADLGREAFRRGEGALGYAGIGVGLYISRLIAEGHGGRIELASEGEGKGTTASLILRR